MADTPSAYSLLDAIPFYPEAGAGSFDSFRLLTHLDSAPSLAGDMPPVVCAVQPDVRLAEPGAPVLRARGVVTCPPTGATQVVDEGG